MAARLAPPRPLDLGGFCTVVRGSTCGLVWFPLGKFAAREWVLTAQCSPLPFREGGLGRSPVRRGIRRSAPGLGTRGRGGSRRDYGRARPAPLGFGTLGVPRTASSTFSEQVGGAERLPGLDRRNLGVTPASPWP